MHKTGIALGALCAAVALPAAAADDAELRQIRDEIRQLKESYESRIQALEARLKQAEGSARTAQEAAQRAEQQAQTAAAQPAAAPPPATGGGGATAFNPAVALILQGGYRSSSEDPATRSITGYAPAGEAGLGDRGFNVDESELSLSANVDQLFYGQATFSVVDGSIEVEEAFAQTPALGHGLTLRLGRAFSGLGYMNSQHAHAWDFADPSLVQNTFLGPNLGMDSVSASWIAPLPVLLELGADLGKPVDFPFGDSNHSKNGFSAATLFAHLGDDIGLSHSYRLGAWWMQADNRADGTAVLDFDDRTGVGNTLSGGDTRLWGLDFVYKWAPDGNSTQRNFKLVAEWMHRRIDGDLTYDTAGAGITDAFRAGQSGWYVQGVYQFIPQWRVGLRYDRLDDGSVDAGVNGANGITAADFTPERWSAMVDWSPSEFSRLRVQFNQDKSQQGLTDDQWFLQYIYSLGAHGAHKF